MPSKPQEDEAKRHSDNGILYVVATPIGNLKDITLRAIEVLKHVDAIASEDTRHTAVLLKAYDIPTRMVSYHEHNERERTAQLVEQLLAGKSIALVSDAGTPLISDPGFRLVREAAAHRIPIVSVPGACAAIAALSASGFPTDAFVFLGFPPKKNRERFLFLSSLASEEKTLVFYESPKRIERLLQEMIPVFGNRSAALCRELTKIHEEIIRGSISELLESIRERCLLKGELVLLVAGHSAESDPPRRT
ncbi:16S rRNA (cytidine(1402)-2'-O)-methyltransferase [Desulfatirhabdium butyrativorans]|uniref:16S rRNA (cytidine(1402)-2'-O)-methyltransferase n=1 Tax=Desulfatirhabdium butyrativorans TaxID=340467 RepID=UPI0004147AC1|nr:16S rRNA (cytidine(1402)-2'-O)-methyltransferase [Desulfatirhabdium butyrativorans]